MARMLGVVLRDWCPICRNGCGPDCPSTARSKGAARQAEKRAARREAEAALADEFASFAGEAAEWAEVGLPAFAETLGHVPW